MGGRELMVERAVFRLARGNSDHSAVTARGSERPAGHVARHDPVRGLRRPSQVPVPGGAQSLAASLTATMLARLGTDFSHSPVQADGPARPGPAGLPSPAQRVAQVLSSPGRPLRPDVASSMGGAFGADFSAVRLHDGPDAAASAHAVGAVMYTSGTHIVAGQDHPDLGSPAGRRALAHELYHVKQQSEGAVAGTPVDGGLVISDPADPGERAAQQAAEHIASTHDHPGGEVGGREEERSPRAGRPPLRGAQFLQRLTEEEVRGSVGDGHAPNASMLTEQVIARIVAVTTEWENDARQRGVQFPDDKMRGILSLLFQDKYFVQELPEPADPDFWAGEVGELIAKWYPGPEPQPVLGAPGQQGRIPLVQRTVIHCTMGQGVIANLARYSLFSDQFSTCSPVVMFNEQTLQAGLFHYGASSTKQRAELKDMHDKISPTYIGLNPRELAVKSGPSEGDDVSSLTKFFADEIKTTAAIQQIKLQSNQYAVFLPDTGHDLRVRGQMTVTATSYDATNIEKSGALNTEVGLLVNPTVYTKSFATGRYK
jgi:hypothetical protein